MILFVVAPKETSHSARDNTALPFPKAEPANEQENRGCNEGDAQNSLIVNGCRCAANIEAVSLQLNGRIDDVLKNVNDLKTIIENQCARIAQPQRRLVADVRVVNDLVAVHQDEEKNDAEVTLFLDGLHPSIIIDTPEAVDKLESKIADERVMEYYVRVDKSFYQKISNS